MNIRVARSLFAACLAAGFAPATGAIALEKPTQLAQAAVPQPPVSYRDQLIDRATRALEGTDGRRNPARAVALLQESVKAGSTRAMLILAELYAAGDGIPADFDKAISLLEQAAAAGEAVASARALAELYLNGDPAHRDANKAIAAYQTAVDLGDPDAMLALARIFSLGMGVPVDVGRAAALLEQASAAQPVEASLALGDLYRNAPPPGRDIVKAKAAYEKAVELGDPQAMLSLADLISSPEAGDVDFDKAKALLEKAIAAGLAAPGSRALGDLYRETGPEHRDLAKAEQSYLVAIDLGDTSAMIALASMLATGDGIPADFERARKLLEDAIAAGDIRSASRTLGDLYLNATGDNRDPAKAAKAYQAAVDLGDNASRIALARMLAAGNGVKADFGKARVLLEAAVAAGDVRNGSRALGDLYRQAEGTNRNPAMAEVAYARAAELGDPWAMIALGRMLSTGDGVPADFKRAESLLERAVAAGANLEGTRALADLYRRSAEPNRDPVKAAKAYQALADTGDTGAMIELADMYFEGDGVAADFNTARTLLEKAIAAGDVARGARALGDLYRTAQPPLRDPAKAEAAYKLAIEAGDTSALVTLAGMYAIGDGIAANFEEAQRLLQTAIDAGDSAGYRTLGDLYRNADGENRDAAKAAAAYEKAIELSDARAMVSLAQMLVRGEGVAVDFDRAKVLLERAKTNGQVLAAARALGDLYRAPENSGRDPKKAEEAYSEAIQLGDSWSMISLASMIAKGDGIPVDFSRAETLLNNAVAAGNTLAASRALGDLYRTADPSHRDGTKAAAAYAKAVDLGDTVSMVSLAGMLGTGQDVPLDFDRARGLLEAAVTAGSVADASRAMGDLYFKAKPPNQDLGKARAAYERAIEAGDSWAMVALANMYWRGEGVIADTAMAQSLFEKAVAAGNVAVGGKLLGDLYLGVPDLEKARDAYTKAAGAGNDQADLALGLLLAQSFPDPKSRGLAIDHLRAASKVVGAESVASAMMQMPSEPLVTTVQQLLRSFGYTGPIDGVHGPGTEAAIVSFCKEHTVENCDGSFVSFGLLVQLLSVSAT